MQTYVTFITISYVCPIAAISIGFGQAEYTFTKGGQPGSIILVKDDGVVTEQTIHVQVTTDTSAVENQAMYNVDFAIGGNPVQYYSILPHQQYISFSVNIFNDTSVTGTIQTTLVSACSLNSVPYDTPHYPTTTLVILNKNGGFI